MRPARLRARRRGPGRARAAPGHGRVPGPPPASGRRRCAVRAPSRRPAPRRRTVRARSRGPAQPRPVRRRRGRGRRGRGGGAPPRRCPAGVRPRWRGRSRGWRACRRPPPLDAGRGASRHRAPAELGEGPAACRIRWARASSSSSAVTTCCWALLRMRASSSSTAANRPVSKSRPRSLARSSAPARRNRAKSPCGRRTTWQNWSLLMPSAWPISSPISWWERLRPCHCPVAGSQARSSQRARSRVSPVPRALGRICSGERVISSRRPATVSSRTTWVRVPGAAWSLRSVPPGCWRAPGTLP